MLTIKLAFKNITHAGIRTWLNVFVLSFAFVLIVFTDRLETVMTLPVPEPNVNVAT